MGMLGTLFPDPITLPVPADAVVATAVEWLAWRAGGPCQVDAVYANNLATIATVTNTARVQLGKKAAGTGAFAQIADFDAASGWTANTPRTGTMTATVANTKLVSGDWLAVLKTLVGTGVTTGLVVIVNVIEGHKN